MMSLKAARLCLAFCVCALASACGPRRETAVALPPAEQSTAEARETAPVNLQPPVTVYKTAACDCCGKWIEHMQSHGFAVKVRNTEDLGPVRERLGVPYGKGSCHTAEVAGYFIEGHVPATEVQRLLAEKPQARGLAVPGMPIGSPGMEQGGAAEPYDVLLVHPDGSTSIYASH